MVKSDIYNELKLSLPSSTAEIRKNWAKIICEQDIKLTYLSKLLNCEKKISSRFLWLLSDIGQKDPKKLFRFLPALLEMSENIDHINFEASFPGYWLIAGVPEQQESKAIDLLFKWLQSSKTTVTTKSRSMFVLFKLSKKYPELKNELLICLADQKDKNTKEFEKRVERLIIKLDQ